MHEAWNRNKTEYDRREKLRRQRYVTLGEVEDIIEIVLHQVDIDVTKQLKIRTKKK